MDVLVGSGVAPVLGTVGDELLPVELEPLLVEVPFEELPLFELALPVEPLALLFWLSELVLLLSEPF
jgi:hypothetical protein